ncbi:MAG: hypothetical protein R2812_10590 [Gelidibacter sp.]
MDSDFKSRQILFLVQCTAFTLVLFGIHSWVLSYVAEDGLFFFPIWQIYSFHFVVTVIMYSIINYKFSKGKTDIFNTFMVTTISKMLLAILFLLPILLSDFKNKQPDVFNFFVPYFLYLFFEVYGLTKFLQKK